MEQQFFHGLSEPLYFFQTMNISLNYDFFYSTVVFVIKLSLYILNFGTTGKYLSLL